MFAEHKILVQHFFIRFFGTFLFSSLEKHPKQEQFPKSRKQSVLAPGTRQKPEDCIPDTTHPAFTICLEDREQEGRPFFLPLLPLCYFPLLLCPSNPCLSAPLFHLQTSGTQARRRVSLNTPPLFRNKLYQ